MAAPVDPAKLRMQAQKRQGLLLLFFAALGLFIIKAREYGGARLEVDMDRLFQSVVPAIAIAVCVSIFMTLVAAFYGKLAAPFRGANPYSAPKQD